MASVQIVRSTVIDAPVEEVWRLLRDFNGHAGWHPAIAPSRMEDGAATDLVGGVRAFDLAGGGHLREQLIALSDRERRLTYCLVEAPVRLDGYVATMSLKPVTDGDRTLLVWQSRFVPPPDQAQALARLVAEEVYEAGFAALQRRFRRSDNHREPVSGPSPAIQPLPAAVALRSRGGETLRAQAIVVERHGGPEVLVPRLVDVPPPGPGEVRIRQAAVGVNHIDLHCRAGEVALMALPGTPGLEAAGTVLDIGPGVSHLAPGDRVVYACHPPGAYAALRSMAADLVVRLPRDIPEDAAAAVFLKGLMADILATDVHPPRPGDVALVRAAAGGVGLILARLLKAGGMTVVGAVSTPEKAAAARRAGCDHVACGDEGDVAEAVRTVTAGRGVDVVFDGLGRDSFEASLELLARRGHLVSYGQASGPLGERNLDRLAARSARLSRPSFGHYAGQRDELAARAARLFALVRDGTVRPEIAGRLPLDEAAEAHRRLASRRTIGSLVLIPAADGGPA